MAFIIDPSAPADKPATPATGQQPAGQPGIHGGGAPAAAPGGTAGGGDLVKEGTTASFMADVIEASRQQPVIVDFWAPWCGPCKQLGPALEKLVHQQKGLVRMVKINVDENQELAAQMRIQSIPAVYAFSGGQPVDGFVGALPDSQLREFVQRLLGDTASPMDDALEHARQMLEQGEGEAAHEVYAQILSEDPANAEATAGLLRALISLGRATEAHEIGERLVEPLRSEARVAAAIGAVNMALETETVGNADTAALEARVAENPADPEARFELATALYAHGNTEAALDNLIELVRRNRTWNDEAARKQILKIFDALGPTHATTAEYRRKLSAVLFT